MHPHEIEKEINPLPEYTIVSVALDAGTGFFSKSLLVGPDEHNGNKALYKINEKGEYGEKIDPYSVFASWIFSISPLEKKCSHNQSTKF